MAYEPKTWACGDTITADDLNHIEQGVAQSGGGMTVNVVQRTGQTTFTIDKTCEEIIDYVKSGKYDVEVKYAKGMNEYIFRPYMLMNAEGNETLYLNSYNIQFGTDQITPSNINMAIMSIYVHGENTVKISDFVHIYPNS